MKSKFFVVLLLVFAAAALSACGSKKPVLNVYNWGDYIDPTILSDFEKEYDCKIIYDSYPSNEDLYAKMKTNTTDYDVVIPSDYLIGRLINEDMLQKLDKSRIEGFKNIDPNFLNLEFDKNNEYSVPYFWGTVGIVYDTNVIKEDIDSWAALWDEKYKKKFTMIDSQRDSIMIALKYLGYSMNTTDEAELEEAKQKLIEQKPLVLAYVGDKVQDMLLAGEVPMAVVWSGDASWLIQQYPNMKYILPKEGTNIWYDNMVIPKSSKNVDLAHKFIDFLCRPEISKRNSEYVGYSTANKKAMELLDQSLFPSDHGYPPAEKIKDYEIFRHPGELLKIYDRIWTELKAH